ncbi:MAG: endonuclease [Frankiales bacterium]|nr:endonuclease [Frankiales bacterium]
MHHGTSKDPILLALIERGALTADPLTGHLTLNGVPVGKPRPDGRLLFWLGRDVFLAHRAIWLACVRPIPDGFDVNHRNGRAWDNRLENLELTLQVHNNRHHRAEEYAAVGFAEGDGNVVDLAWLAQALALAERGDVSREEIEALIPTDRPRKPYYVRGWEPTRQDV